MSDADNWEQVKLTLLMNVGMAAIPVIRITDADFGRNRELCLRHEHDGRDLDPEHAERTLRHVYRLWGRKVHPATLADGRPVELTWDAEGFGHETAASGSA